MYVPKQVDGDVQTYTQVFMYVNVLCFRHSNRTHPTMDALFPPCHLSGLGSLNKKFVGSVRFGASRRKLLAACSLPSFCCNFDPRLSRSILSGHAFFPLRAVVSVFPPHLPLCVYFEGIRNPERWREVGPSGYDHGFDRLFRTKWFFRRSFGRFSRAGLKAESTRPRFLLPMPMLSLLSACTHTGAVCNNASSTNPSCITVLRILQRSSCGIGMP